MCNSGACSLSKIYQFILSFAYIMEYSNINSNVVMMFFLALAVMCSKGSSSNMIIVSKDGSGHYRTVGEAIRNAPYYSEQPYNIHILAGIYEEYILIPPSKTNIKLLGHGSTHTIILGRQNGSTIGTLTSLPHIYFVILTTSIRPIRPSNLIRRVSSGIIHFYSH
jgi:pectin methylesterase-like acyl-CoA thioesterase